LANRAATPCATDTSGVTGGQIGTTPSPGPRGPTPTRPLRRPERWFGRSGCDGARLGQWSDAEHRPRRHRAARAGSEQGLLRVRERVRRAVGQFNPQRGDDQRPDDQPVQSGSRADDRARRWLLRDAQPEAADGLLPDPAPRVRILSASRTWSSASRRRRSAAAIPVPVLAPEAPVVGAAVAAVTAPEAGLEVAERSRRAWARARPGRRWSRVISSARSSAPGSPGCWSADRSRARPAGPS